MRACWFIQLGYPGEGWEEILATRDLVRAGRPDEIGVSVAYPLPGTKFHRVVADQMRGRRNWVDSDDLAMLFQGTYTTGFYRRVRDLLHREVDEGPRLAGRGWAHLAAEGTHIGPPTRWPWRRSGRDTDVLPPPVRAFDAVAGGFDERFGPWLSVRAQRDAVRRILLAAFPAGTRLLELGGGTGEDAAWLARQGRSVPPHRRRARMSRSRRTSCVHARAGGPCGRCAASARGGRGDGRRRTHPDPSMAPTRTSPPSTASRT